jgi:apolipoprotein N-acyltransferase
MAFPPVSQFYMAWFGLVPWVVLVHSQPSLRRAFLLSWVAGTLFFCISISWLVYVTVPGTIGSAAYMGLYWSLAAVLMRVLACPADGSGWRSLRVVLVTSTIWAGVEWLRAWLLTGWPWAFLGHTQTPLLPLVQIADVTGVFGVSFLVAAVNMLIVLLIQQRGRVRTILPAAGALAVLIIAACGYGLWRMSQSQDIQPGPRVLLVQSNFPQSNTGEKGASEEELLAFHVQATQHALDAERAAGRSVDLVVWSETIIPEINAQAVAALRQTQRASVLDAALRGMSDLTSKYAVPLLVGGTYAAAFTTTADGFVIPADRRNVAYNIDAGGRLSDAHYDKIHLVPFGEYIPLRKDLPWVFDLFTTLGLNPYGFDYTLQPGRLADLTVFEVAGRGVKAKVVTPICFEDADAWLVSQMVRPRMPDGPKRADLIINITNDGWFAFTQLPQHLQIARFRSIENRVPTARAVNTGISAFIDSCGRIGSQLPPQTPGVLIGQVALDRRVTVYTRWGDWFAIACCVTIGIMLIGRLLRRRSISAAIGDGGLR